MTDKNEQPPQTAEEYFARAKKRHDSGDFNGAYEDYRETTRRGLNNVDVSILFADIYTARGEHIHAVNVLNQITRKVPNSIEAHIKLGFALSRINKHNEAINAHDKAIGLDSDRAEPWNGKGFAYAGKKEWDNAIEHYDEAIRRNPDYAEALYNRGNTRANKHEWKQSITDYEQAIHLKPDYKEAIHNRSVALALQSSDEEFKQLAQNFKNQYDEQLQRELEVAVVKLTEDSKEFREEGKQNMSRSRILRICSIFLLVIFAGGLFAVFREIYLVEVKNGGLKPTSFLSWAPAVIAISSPLFLLWWMLQRWSHELKTLAYGFQRKAILEERILLFFRNDREKLKRMQELYIAHWMDKSPLEVMLSIGSRGKSMDSSFAKDLLSKMLDKLSNVR